VASHYGAEFARLRAGLFAPPDRPATGRKGRWTGRNEPPRTLPLPTTRGSYLANVDTAGAAQDLREAMILAIAINHPGVARGFLGQIEMLELRGDGHADLRQSLLRQLAGSEARIRENIAAEAGAALEKLFGRTHVQIAPPVRPDADEELVAMCLAEELARLEAQRGMDAEIEDAMADLSGLADEGVTWRLSQAAEARNRAERPSMDDTSDLGEDRAAQSAWIQSLIDNEVWVKKRR